MNDMNDTPHHEAEPSSVPSTLSSVAESVKTGERHVYSPDFKAQLLRALLSERRTVAELAAEHGVDPINIYNWQRQAFDGLTSLFQPKDKELRKIEKRLEKAEEALIRRETALLELSTDHCELKKKWQEMSSGEAGRAPRKGRT